MNKYYLEETEFTPEISLDIDSRKFIFKGVSRPEDVFKFYQPAIKWLKDVDENILTHTNAKYNIPQINIDFHLSYFNSSSSKMLLQILEIVKKIQNKGIEINIDWYYDSSDEQMYDDGMDLSESIDIPFNFHKL
jgi:SiaC family regulatory phosphoprotein